MHVQPSCATLRLSPPPCLLPYSLSAQLLRTMEFDALSFSSDDLVHLTLEMFLEQDFPTKVGVSVEKLQKFILCVRSCMFDNPYHNWQHAFDVTQTTYCMALHWEMDRTLTHVEYFALIISALCHDLEHPGVNNPFLVSSRSDLATLYNDRSCIHINTPVLIQVYIPVCMCVYMYMCVYICDDALQTPIGPSQPRPSTYVNVLGRKIDRLIDLYVCVCAHTHAHIDQGACTYIYVTLWKESVESCHVEKGSA